MHAERAPLHRNRFDAVRVDDTSFGPHEVETPLEFVPSGERKHTIESIGRERPESIRGFRSPSVDHAMSAELADQARRRGAGCGGDDMSPALTGELNCHRPDGTRGTKDQDGVARTQPERIDTLQGG